MREGEVHEGIGLLVAALDEKEASLASRRGAPVYEAEGEPGPETDEVAGYLASEELQVAMEKTAAMN
jgi:hypothetical protein